MHNPSFIQQMNGLTPRVLAVELPLKLQNVYKIDCHQTNKNGLRFDWLNHCWGLYSKSNHIFKGRWPLMWRICPNKTTSFLIVRYEKWTKLNHVEKDDFCKLIFLPQKKIINTRWSLQTGTSHIFLLAATVVESVSCIRGPVSRYSGRVSLMYIFLLAATVVESVSCIRDPVSRHSGRVSLMYQGSKVRVGARLEDNGSCPVTW